jgi:hypothetical protein
MHLMETFIDNTSPADQNSNAAADYRLAHRNRLMVLTTLKSDIPSRDEFCRIRSVETVAPSLWLTVSFLDGSSKGLRPGKIRLATEDEEQFSKEALG